MTKLIAEVGSNHLGSLELACAHIDAAKSAGADIVKFQFIIPRNVIRSSEPTYPHINNLLNETQRERWERVSLTINEMDAVHQYCEKVGIEFLCTPFCFESLEWVAEHCDRIKIASSDSGWHEFVQACINAGKEILISTGVSDYAEIKALSEILPEGSTLFHCVSQYPASLEKSYLGDLDFIRSLPNVQAGLSDHSKGIVLPVSLALSGLSYIEKHFIISRSLPAGDASLSVEPDELQQMALACSLVKVKDQTSEGIQKSELSGKFNRGLYFARELSRGDILSADDVVALRPQDGSGFSANELHSIIGRQLTKDVSSEQGVFDDCLF
jgi:N,N'-diacetyllegionaminate synthase